MYYMYETCIIERTRDIVGLPACLQYINFGITDQPNALEHLKKQTTFLSRLIT